jgi:hypothetical protein
MTKLSLIFLALFNLNCAGLPHEPVIYKPRLKVIEHDGEKLICQDEADTIKLYKRLRQCEDVLGPSR